MKEQKGHPSFIPKTLQFGDVMAEGYTTEVNKIMSVIDKANGNPLFTVMDDRSIGGLEKGWEKPSENLNLTAEDAGRV